jgi:two-component system, NarL family, nitrate/nitrite response regulator NarL
MTVRILIVEDNHTTRHHLSRVVRESFDDELWIDLAEDFDSACAHLQTPAYDLVLIDLALPDDQGLTLLEQAALVPDLSTTLSVATTLSEDDDLLFPALQRGACAYLLKENRFEVLVEELQKIASGQAPVSPAIARRLLAHFKNPAHCAPADTADFTLTALERETLGQLSKGYTLKETALRMGMKMFAACDVIQQTYQKFQLNLRKTARARHVNEGSAGTF